MALQRLTLEQLRVDPGERFRIRDHDPRWLPPHLRGSTREELRTAAAELLETNKTELETAQDLLYADDRYSLLLVFQAMDAAGKDSTIKHVMSGVNPQGVQVSSFKVPSSEELDHDFLWRYSKALPERGRIGIFNRSYYEEVLVVKVHPEILEKQRLPPGTRGKAFWQRRYDDINAFEKHLTDSGTVILKFFLNVSHDEQRRRFLARLEEPRKHWKFSPADLPESARWDDYMKAFEECISATTTPWAPWWVIPADRKWAMRTAVADIVTTTIRSMKLRYPPIGPDQQEAIGAARAELRSQLGLTDEDPTAAASEKQGRDSKNSKKSKKDKRKA